MTSVSEFFLAWGLRFDLETAGTFLLETLFSHQLFPPNSINLDETEERPMTKSDDREILSQIQERLRQISANGVRTSLVWDFEPHDGTVVKVEINQSYWHLLPDHFLTLIKELPPSAGDEEVRNVIEKQAIHVWHGAAPEGTRET